jgi:hypothetical protein
MQIGQNDVQGEVFRQSDARQVLDFASKTPWVSLISFWSVNRDNSFYGPLFKSSQINQTNLEFCNIFKSYESGLTPTASPTPKTSIATSAMTSATPTASVAPFIGYQWGDKVFAPYVNTLANASEAMLNASYTAGVLRYTIAYMDANSKGDPAFNGNVLMSSGYLVKEIAMMRLYGGDIIMSFGGPKGSHSFLKKLR